jgi:tetratricopeptide (TPR) repeat protein
MLPSVFNDFTFDDVYIIRKNPLVHSLGHLPQIWTTDWWAGLDEPDLAIRERRDRLYRPLTLTTFALNSALHGLTPAGFLATNIGLHVLATVLVWFLTRRLFADRTVAVWAALLFAVHPVHVEAVAGVVGRAEVLSAILLMGGLLVLLPQTRPLGLRRGALAALLFFAALTAKETAICYPAVAVLALLLARLTPRGTRERLGLVLGLALPLVVYFPLRYAALEGHLMYTMAASFAVNPLTAADAVERVFGALVVLGQYARLLLAPAQLSCDYGYAVVPLTRVPTPMAALGAVAALGLAAGLLGGWRRAAGGRQAALLCAMFLASYALISNTALLIGTTVAERLMYWPSVAFVMLVALLAVAGARRIAAREGRPTVPPLIVGVGVALVAVFGLRSALRTLDWASSLHLFATDVETQPNSAHLHYALATAYVNYSQQQAHGVERNAALDLADQQAAAALQIHPAYVDALRLRGMLARARGDLAAASEFLAVARVLGPIDERAQRATVGAFGQQVALEQRVRDLQAQLTTQPADTHLQTDLAEAYLDLGRTAEALAVAEQVVRRVPGDLAALRVLARTQMARDQQEAARATLEQIIARDPRDWQAHTNLAAQLAADNPAAAVRHARIACELNPTAAEAAINLAGALIANGQEAEALREYRAILAALPQDHPLRAAIAEHVARLQGGH